MKARKLCQWILEVGLIVVVTCAILGFIGAVIYAMWPSIEMALRMDGPQTLPAEEPQYDKGVNDLHAGSDPVIRTWRVSTVEDAHAVVEAMVLRFGWTPCGFTATNGEYLVWATVREGTGALLQWDGDTHSLDAADAAELQEADDAGGHWHVLSAEYR